MRVRSLLILGMIFHIVTGCTATGTSPEELKLADARKNRVQSMAVQLEVNDFSSGCGWTKPNESVGCSQQLLRRKLEAKAKEYCIKYAIGDVSWTGAPGLYPRSTSATAVVTCTGVNIGK